VFSGVFDHRELLEWQHGVVRAREMSANFKLRQRLEANR
jgi:hypothetical protein